MQSAPFKRHQQLQPEDRVTLVSLAQQKYSVRAMAQVLGRFPSTISRALRRNAQPGGYASTTARTFAQRHALRAVPRASFIVMASCSG
nr:helix-turn-helix domain-containing protein [Hydrogenophaga sp. A37]